MEAFKKKLRALSKVRDSTVQTYMFNIRRLARLAGHDTIPEKGAWLNTKKLRTLVAKENLNTRKLLSAAAVKASGVYGQNMGTWLKLMTDYSKQYASMRDDRKKTPREKALWPAGGYKTVYAAGQKLQDKIKKSPGDWKWADFRKAQRAWLLLFYGKHTPRLIHNVGYGGSSVNQIKKSRGRFSIILKDHKTSKSRGTATIKLDKALTEPTQDLITAAKRLTKHTNLLSNALKKPISKASLSKLLTITMQSAGFKSGFSVQLLRVLKSSENRELIQKAQALENEMGHGARESLRYAKK
jgi:hypothetical protein